MEEKLITNISSNVELCDLLVKNLNTDFVLVYWHHMSQWYLSVVHYLGETTALDIIDFIEPESNNYTTDIIKNVKKITLDDGCIIYHQKSMIELSIVSKFIINAHINTLIYKQHLHETSTDYTSLLLTAVSLKPAINSLLHHKSIYKQVLQVSNNIFDIIDLIKLRTNSLITNINTINLVHFISSISSIIHVADTVPQMIRTDELRLRQLLLYLVDDNQCIIIVTTGDVNYDLTFEIKSNKILTTLHLTLCNLLANLLHSNVVVGDNSYLLNLSQLN
jgi:hypothetical protein